MRAVDRHGGGGWRTSEPPMLLLLLLNERSLAAFFPCVLPLYHTAVNYRVANEIRKKPY